MEYITEPTLPTYDCVATLSGGIDSTVLLHDLIVNEGMNPLAVYVDYGTVVRDAELKAARRTCEKLGRTLYVLPFPQFADITDSFLLGNESKYEAGLQFWSEGRNTLIALMMVSLAVKVGAEDVYLGINYGDDSTGYVDTGMNFLHAVNLMVAHGYRGRCSVNAPWLELAMCKSEIINYAIDNGFDINWVEDTHSCSSSNDRPCCDYENCESCIDRKHDFEDAGLQDPFYRG